MARTTAAHAAATAQRVREVATAHFAERGYAAASVDDIATAAGVTRGAVYHHYVSKPGLFEAVAEALQLRVADAIAAAAEASDPAVALRSGSHAFLDAITETGTARILLVDAPAVLTWETWRRMDDEGSVAHLREALEAVGVTSPLVGPVAAALSGAMNELALWLSERPTDAAAHVHAHRSLDLLLDAAMQTAHAG